MDDFDILEAQMEADALLILQQQEEAEAVLEQEKTDTKPKTGASNIGSAEKDDLDIEFIAATEKQKNAKAVAGKKRGRPAAKGAVVDDVAVSEEDSKDSDEGTEIASNKRSAKRGKPTNFVDLAKHIDSIRETSTRPAGKHDATQAQSVELQAFKDSKHKLSQNVQQMLSTLDSLDTATSEDLQALLDRAQGGSGGGGGKAITVKVVFPSAVGAAPVVIKVAVNNPLKAVFTLLAQRVKRPTIRLRYEGKEVKPTNCMSDILEEEDYADDDDPTVQMEALVS